MAQDQAQDTAAQQQTRSDGRAGLFGMIPPDATTEHVLTTQTGKLAYKATAGTLDLFDGTGTPSAKIFYTAYVADDAAKDRPLTFVFNGGPGAASAYLHLGLVGPRILQFDKDADAGTRPELSDNPDSWLAFTDLVFIDPVGTGWSRAADESKAKGFYGVDSDAESLAKAIALYTQKNNRLAAPKYLLGESYGGFRAAKVAAALKESQGILTSGAIMISPLIDGRFLPDHDLDPVQAAVQLPSLAAAKMEREGTFSAEKMADVEQFAMGDYLVSLAGPAPSGEEADRLYGHIADLTGLPEQTVADGRGFIGDAYTKQSAGPGKVVSLYDGGRTVADAYPEFSGNHNDDVILDGYTRAYGPAFAAYARNALNFDCQITYSLLNTDVNRKWDWDGSREDADASGDLRDLLSTIPAFRLAIFQGYSDILTPYGASRYVLDHLPPTLSEGRTELKLYRGGHMFYTDPDQRRSASADAEAFYAAQTTN
ncbi:S10 family peptidase [Rhizobium halophytocola]|nr:carboxypeptidase [Rhizobium halophytocola]